MARPEFSTSVAVRHLPEQSDRDKGQFAFAYSVTIVNTGDVPAQLIGRGLLRQVARDDAHGELGAGHAWHSRDGDRIPP